MLYKQENKNARQTTSANVSNFLAFERKNKKKKMVYAAAMFEPKGELRRHKTISFKSLEIELERQFLSCQSEIVCWQKGTLKKRN